MHDHGEHAVASASNRDIRLRSLFEHASLRIKCAIDPEHANAISLRYTMKPLDSVFEALVKSAFRRRFRLADKERVYLEAKGLPVVLTHAADFVAKRLAPAEPVNDGKQTPYRGHPVFVAQHATACCCRSCLEKWHGIPRGRPLDAAEQAHVVAALERWLRKGSL